MEQETQKQLEILLDLFEHEGWELFIDEQDKLLTSLKESAYMSCPDNDSWQQIRGVIDTLSKIVSYENTIKYVIEQNQEEDNGSEDL